MLESLTVTNVIIVIVSLLVSLSIHEATHAFVGLKLGDDTAAEQGRVSFNPLRHIDPVMTLLLPVITLLIFHVPILAAKPVPFNPERVRWGEYGAALIAAAGPFSNLLLAFIGVVVAHFVVDGTLIAQFIITFIGINAALFVFNLIPIPPLDGSRVLYAFAPDPLRRVMEQLETVGLFIVFGLVLFGFGGFISNWVNAVQLFLFKLF